MNNFFDKFFKHLKDFYDHNLKYVLGYILIISFILIGIKIVKTSLFIYKVPDYQIGEKYSLAILEVAIALMYFALQHSEDK